MRPLNPLNGGAGPSRRRLVVAVILLAVLATGGAGAYYHEQGQLQAELKIVSISDPHGIGRGTTITLHLINREQTSIRPVFNVITTDLSTRFYYHIQSGPQRLAPGEAGLYTLTAPTPAAAAPPGGQVLVTANDAGTQRRVQSGPLTFTENRHLPIANPQFAFWTVTPNRNTPGPVGWTRSKSHHGREDIVIQPAGREGAVLSVSNITQRDGPWAMAGLHQQIRFPRMLTVSATPTTVVERPVRYPPAPTGIELADGNRRLWIVFANVSQRTMVERKTTELEYRILYIPAQSGERTTFRVNVSSMYQKSKWPIRDKSIDLLVFAATYPTVTQEPASVTFHTVNSTDGMNGPESTEQHH